MHNHICALKITIGTTFGGSAEGFHWDLEAHGGGGLIKEKVESSTLHLLSVQNFPHCSFWFGSCYLGQEEETSMAFVESLGNATKFWIYWQYSWGYGVRYRSVGHSDIFELFLNMWMWICAYANLKKNPCTTNCGCLTRSS